MILELQTGTETFVGAVPVFHRLTVFYFYIFYILIIGILNAAGHGGRG